MKNIKTILAVSLLALSSCQAVYAQTTEEFVASVGKALNKNWAAPGQVFGKVIAEVHITPQGAVLYKSSGNPAFDKEVVRAANSVLDDTVQTNIVFPVEYRRGTSITGFDYVEGVGYRAN